jgi:DNA-binding transcriptional ArsR family regulator
MLNYEKESELLKALAHPVRLKMVQGLLNHECHVDKIVKALNLPQSTVSQHLSVLKNRGIVQIRKEGVKTCYRVSDRKIAPLLKILSQKG